MNQESLLLDCMLWSLVDDRIVTAYSSSRLFSEISACPSQGKQIEEKPSNSFAERR